MELSRHGRVGRRRSAPRTLTRLGTPTFLTFGLALPFRTGGATTTVRRTAARSAACTAHVASSAHVGRATRRGTASGATADGAAGGRTRGGSRGGSSVVRPGAPSDPTRERRGATRSARTTGSSSCGSSGRGSGNRGRGTTGRSNARMWRRKGGSPLNIRGIGKIPRLGARENSPAGHAGSDLGTSGRHAAEVQAFDG